MNVIISKPENYTSSKPHEKYPIITINGNNPEWGFIMLRSNVMSITPNGFRNEEKRVGRYIARVEDLVKDVETFKLKEGDDFGKKVFPVKLVIKEQTEPFYDGQEPKINPSSGEVITHNGQEIYRNTFVQPLDSAEPDTVLSIDREPVEAEKQLQPNTEFAQQ